MIKNFTVVQNNLTWLVKCRFCERNQFVNNVIGYAIDFHGILLLLIE